MGRSLGSHRRRRSLPSPHSSIRRTQRTGSDGKPPWLAAGAEVREVLGNSISYSRGRVSHLFVGFNIQSESLSVGQEPVYVRFDSGTQHYDALEPVDATPEAEMTAESERSDDQNTELTADQDSAGKNDDTDMDYS